MPDRAGVLAEVTTLAGHARRQHLRPRDRPLQRGRAGRADPPRRGRRRRAPAGRARRPGLPPVGHPAGVSGAAGSDAGRPDRRGPFDVVVSLPGSKSITNRALVCAALADGTSTLTNALHADDTEAMVDGLRALGAEVDADWGAGRLVVTGTAGQPTATWRSSTPGSRGPQPGSCCPSRRWARGIGASTARTGCASDRWRRSLDAVRALGAAVHDVGAPGHLPVEVDGGTLVGGEVAVRGDVSSQFLSGLLLAGPAMRSGLVARLVGDLVSQPYVDMTVAVMASFGVQVEQPGRRAPGSSPRRRTVPPTSPSSPTPAPRRTSSRRLLCWAVAPPWTASVTASLQGDLAFVDVLEQMGATVERGDGPHDGHRHRAAARRRGRHEPAVGHRADAGGGGRLRRRPDTGHRHRVHPREGDRSGGERGRRAAPARDRRRSRSPTGSRSTPAPLRPATVQTYDDHRMAMAFALAGLRSDGVQIADPGCVAKTFPGYWRLLDELRAPSASGAMVRRP